MIQLNINSSPRCQQQGFALVVSLLLMAFILLLLLSITTLVSVETRVADQSIQKLRAEQNAMLALYIALGELQKATGPDQRVTARADLQFSDTATNPYWTGVYGHSLTPAYALAPERIAAELTNTDKVDTQGSPAKLLAWLVSGNPTANTWPQFAATGEIETMATSANFFFLPDAIVGNVADGTSVGATDITLQDRNGVASPARILVGEGSVADSQDYVLAPLVEIEPQSGNHSGGFAWWIGDENVKALGNLPIQDDPDDLANAFVNATRSAIELMAAGDSGGALDEPRIGSAYDPYSPVERAYQTGELTLISAGDSSQFSQVLKKRFHDITMSSVSLITDSFSGGLKQDMTALLDQSYTSASGDPTEDANPLWALHESDSSGHGVPTWKHLRSFVQTRIPEGQNGIQARLPAHGRSDLDDDVGVAPVLTYAGVGVSFSPRLGAYNANDYMYLNLHPLIVLWNPYAFTIKAPDVVIGDANFEVGVLLTTPRARIALDIADPGVITRADNSTEEYYWRQVASFDFKNGIVGDLGNASEHNDAKFMRFRLNCPDIPPGQSLVFSVPAALSGELYSEDVVLENIEPEENSYISVPIYQFEKNYSADTEFRIGPVYAPNHLYWASHDPQYITNSLSLDLLPQDGRETMSSGGRGIFTYLGVPKVDHVSVAPNNDFGYNPTNPDNFFYQTHQGVEFQEITVSNYIVERNILTQVGSPPEDVVIEGGQQVNLMALPTYFDSIVSQDYLFLQFALFSGDGNNGEIPGNQSKIASRWIAQGNIRAVRSGRTLRDGGYNPLMVGSSGASGEAYPWQNFISVPSNGNRTSAGSSHDSMGNQPVDAVLFEFLSTDREIISIGQLQHANLSLVGAYPSYPIGNSLADYRMHRRSQNGDLLNPEDYELARIDTTGRANAGLYTDMEAYYDISYLLNRNLWDRYFFSSVPRVGEIPEQLPNVRMRVIDDTDTLALRAPSQAAANLLIKGGFNVNSTSEQAWRAVLGGVHQLSFDPVSQSATMSGLRASFPRFSHPTADDDLTQAWEGYRSLSEEQIARLARNIVSEIKARGPFVSLSDFINRRLVDNPETAGVVGSELLRGTIQAALDKTWNVSQQGNGDGSFPVNDGSNDFWSRDQFAAGEAGMSHFKAGNGYAYDEERFFGGTEKNSPYSSRSAFSPKYVTQADVLSTIGANLTSRSDTFTIRAYGEVASLLSGNNEAEAAGVWCEAVVSREPDYIDSEEPAQDAPGNAVNRSFGRRYKIISFRWITKEEV